MKFGIIPREWGDFIEEAIEQSVLAEKLGFDSLWIEEHHGNELYLPSPLMALAALSQHVKKLKIGTAIAVLPLYNPVRFASDCSVLDNISKGRLVIGVAVGYRKHEFDVMNVDFSRRGEIMDEYLEVLLKLLEGKVVNYSGKLYRIENFKLEPPPLQKPRPQIWIGGWKRRAIERAAKFGDRWFPGQVADFDYLAKAREIYIEALNKFGKKFSGFSLIREAYLAASEEQALSDVKESVACMYGTDYATSKHPLLRSKSSSIEEFVKNRFIIGTPSQAIETIDRLRKMGVDHLVLRVSLRRLSHKKILESIRLFGKKVLPYFR